MDEDSQIVYKTSIIVNTQEDAPYVFTNLSKVTASKIMEKGKPHVTFTGKVVPHKLNEKNIWRYNMENVTVQELYYPNHRISDVLKLIHDNTDLKRALQKYPDHHILISCYYKKQRPYMFIGRDLIKQLSDHNIPVEIDFYTE